MKIPFQVDIFKKTEYNILIKINNEIFKQIFF